MWPGSPRRSGQVEELKFQPEKGSEDLTKSCDQFDSFSQTFEYMYVCILGIPIITDAYLLIQAPRKLRQEDCKCEGSLGYLASSRSGCATERDFTPIQKGERT